MQPDKFRYTLVINGVENVLKNAPSGWEDTFLNYKRSPDYWGLIRSFTVPLSFVLDGAYLLRKEFYEKGLNSVTTLKIEVLNNRNWSYKLVYSGEVDYTQFNDSENSVSVKVTDTGVAEAVASSDKAVYEISLNSLKAVTVEIPSVSLIDLAQLLVLPQQYDLPNGYTVLPLDVIENGLINQKVETQIVEGAVLNTLIGSDQWFISANENTRVTVSGILEGFTTNTQFNDKVFIELRNGGNQLKGTITTYLVVEGQIPEFKRNYSLTFDVVAGEKIFLTCRYAGTTPFNFRGQFWAIFFSVQITNEVLAPPSQAKAFRAFDLFEILLERMNGKAVPADSILLKQSNLFITCGDSIREFEEPVIKTSFVDFYRSVDAVLGCGFGLDAGQARLEAKEFFFRNIESVKLGAVKSFELTVADPFLFNTLLVGYKESNYEENQGREEFNQGQVWIAPNKKVDSVLERLSVYRADQFGISVLRRLTILDNLQKKDTESDNGIWFLKGSGVEVDGVHKLETGSDFNFISGISNQENSINIDLSPKRCLIRSGSFLSIGLHRYDSKVLAFGSSDKNADLVSEKDGRLVYENQDIAISALRSRLFLPYLVKITTDMPKDSWSLIDDSIFGYFSFNYNGALIKGFIEEAGNDIGSNTEREISLYLHPETNLNNLIK